MKRSITYFFNVILIWVNISLKFAFCVTMTNFSSWQNIMPLYDSSEVFVPAKQYWNTIHSPWIIKRLNDVLCTLVYFRLHVHELSLFKQLISLHNNPPYPYIIGSFILILFFPLTFTVFVPIQNTFTKIKVMWVTIWVLCFKINQSWAFLKFPFCGGFSLYIGQIEVSTSPPGHPPPPGIWLFGQLLRKSPLPKPKCRSNAPH